MNLSIILILFLGLSACSEAVSEETQTSNIVMESGNFFEMPVEGMSCMSCVSSVTSTLNRLEGVSSVDVSLGLKNARFQWDAEKVSLGDIKNALAESGYEAGEPKEVEK